MTKPVNQVTMPSTGGGAGQRLCIKPHPPEPGPGPEAAEDKSLLTGVPASFLPPTLCAQYRGQSDLLNTPVRLCNSWPRHQAKGQRLFGGHESPHYCPTLTSSASLHLLPCPLGAVPQTHQASAGAGALLWGPGLSPSIPWATFSLPSHLCSVLTFSMKITLQLPPASCLPPFLNPLTLFV